MGRRILALLALIAALVPGGARAANPLAPPLCGSAPGATAPAEATLRVASFNALHGNTQEPPLYPAHSTLDERIELQAQRIAAEGIDVLGLQEVSITEANAQTQHLPGNHVARLATRLATLTGWAWHWCWYLANPHFPGEPDLQTGGGGPLSDEIARLAYDFYASFKEGEAVLSKYPIVEAEGRRLPGRVPTDALSCDPEQNCLLGVVFESRVALWAKVDAPGGAVHVISTHLANDALSALTTVEQTAATLAFAEQKAASDPAARRFLLGDFNVETTSTVPVVPLIVAAGWTDTWAAANPGAPGHTSGPDVIVTPSTTRVMNARIDYNFARAGTCPLNLSASAIAVDGPVLTADGYLWPSDHRGVASDFGTGGCA